MPKLINTFIQGFMDKDTDKSFIQSYRHAENLRFHTNGGNDGTGVNIKGTTPSGDATGGNTDLKCVGAYFNENLDVIYYFLASTNGAISKIVEFAIGSQTTTVIAEDTTSVLKFNKAGYITGINEINGLLFFSEWGNNPRRINVERAKTYGIDGYTEDDISLIVKPPLQKLALTLQDSGNEENYLEEIFLSFSYRYRYLDGEYSALAPFTEFAFEPNTFDYDFAEQVNASMVNKFNQVQIDFNTGSERVTEIQLVFKESESNTEWIIDDFNKALLGYSDNVTESFTFDNSKNKRALSDHVIRDMFHNVPLTSKSQTMIDGRLILGYYKEFYDIKDDLDAKINIDFSLSQVNVAIPGLIPKRTVKTNRSYEVGIVYSDAYGRSTTVLESKTNTIYIENSNSITENSIHVTLVNKPPDFATKYRFFIRPSHKGYDQILPTLFYSDGSYRWVKLEGADKNKVKEGDYLIVKSDSQEIKTTLVKTKVLEVTAQEQNFLQPEDVTDEIKEISGLYFKIKPKNFRIDIDDYENFEIETYHNSRHRYHNCLRYSTKKVQAAHWYGDTLDDLTSGGNCTLANMVDKRFLIEIDSLGDNITTWNTFRWSIDNGGSWEAEDVVITPGIAQTLSDGVEITFEFNFGHSLLDYWYVNARGILKSDNSHAYGFFRTNGARYETLTSTGESVEDEVIESGARISLIYDEYNNGQVYWKLESLISSARYDNIQEWFYGEDIGSAITTASPGFDLTKIWFMRGVLVKDGDGNADALEYNEDGYMTMIVESQNTQGAAAAFMIKVRATTTLFQSDGNSLLLFETEPTEAPKGEFFEIGKTYDITGGYHISDSSVPSDVDQAMGVNLVAKLDFFNAYAYGNAVESYKIKDDFNKKGLATGIRTSTITKEEYKQVTRTADVTWSDVYNDETNFNGLNAFNLSQTNFVKLDKEDGSIQKLHNSHRNLMVLQEDAIGMMPYNKNIIYDAEGGKVVGIATNILNKESYAPYANGLYGISTNPESFVAVGHRNYFTDRIRGKIIRLSTDGITTIEDNWLNHYVGTEMDANKGQSMVAGYDPLHDEYLLHLPNEAKTLSFKERPKGFPLFYTYEPDFMLSANNMLYAWKNGVMYEMNSNSTRNHYFGVQYESKIVCYASQFPNRRTTRIPVDFSVEKVFNTIELQSTHAWLANLTTDLTSRQVPKDSFSKKEDFWFSEIMGNTNSNRLASSTFGIGSYPIVGGIIVLDKIPSLLQIGDYIINSTDSFARNKITDIQGTTLTLETNISEASSFLMYEKNANVDGSSIRGDYLEVELISDETAEVILKSISVEATESQYT